MKPEFQLPGAHGAGVFRLCEETIANGRTLH